MSFLRCRQGLQEILHSLHPADIANSSEQRVAAVKATQGSDQLGHGFHLTDGDRIRRFGRLLDYGILGRLLHHGLGRFRSDGLFGFAVEFEAASRRSTVYDSGLVE